MKTSIPATGVLTMLAMAEICTVSAAMLYVSLDSLNPSPPYTNWSTAARVIQDAVDAAAAGDEVVVTNGTYATGGRAVGTNLLVNRVAVDKPLTLRRVNGPLFTVIQGYQVPGTTNGNSAVRCVYLADGASLSGFTLTNGATRVIWGWPPDRESSGGGVWCESESATISNCVVVDNSASYGGGAASGTLSHCTLTGNSAYGGGGVSAFGFYGGITLNNCIVYFNTAADGPNYSDGNVLNFCCTTPLPPDGTGNLSLDPQLASASHLSAASPCRGAGSADSTTGTDIDGEAWATPPSIGCDEYHAGEVTGPLSVGILAKSTNVAVGHPLQFRALIDGRASASSWEYGDGVVISNRPYATHAWAAAGDYAVVLRAYNASQPEGVSATASVHVIPQPVHYVAADSANPAPPYTSWATAAKNIQDAIDAAAVGGEVVVSNGVYATGGRAVVRTMTNRVAVDKPLKVRSVNGPQFTIIEGYQVSDTLGVWRGTGDGAIRCAYLADDASLSGFTLARGATRHGDYDAWQSQGGGGGVWCESTNARVSNCVLAGNSAADFGGGAFGGTLNDCTLTGNSAFDGGGAAGDEVAVCCTLNHCLLRGNSAQDSEGYGGGAYRATLNNCTLTDNSAYDGGGAAGARLYNCISYFNTATSGPNYSQSERVYVLDCTLNYCCTTPMPPNGGGNITNAPMFVNYAAANLRLQSNSPCINAGYNAYAPGSTDLDGHPRIVSGTVDIGAYEFQGPGSVISYAWLQRYGLPTDGSADATDPDADGLNTWQEWRCQTDPINPLSALRLLSAALASSDVIVTWQSVEGASYFLERSTDLGSTPRFSLLATNLLGQPGTTRYTDTNAASLVPLFYRIGVGNNVLLSRTPF